MAIPRVAWGVVSLVDSTTGAPAMPRPTVNSAGVYPQPITVVFQLDATTRRLDVVGGTMGLFQESPGARPNTGGRGPQVGTIYMIGFFHLAGSAPAVATEAVTLTGNTLPSFAAKVVVDSSLYDFSRVQITTDYVWTRSSGSISGAPFPVTQTKAPLSFIPGEPFDAAGNFIWT